MTLVIMAAGMGSRFGGLKQIEPVHSNGEFILDYSIYDALKSGFNKIVFIIKRENYDVFRSTIGKRIENIVKVVYIFQENDNVPDFVKIPTERIKPLGTGHAILCCKDVIDEDFLVINADDFYGRDAFEMAAKYIKEKHEDNQFAMIGYLIGNTLTENGAVKRGVCESDNGYLTKINESNVEKINDEIIVTPLNDDSQFYVEENTLVSMNMFIFTKKIFQYLQEGFISFFNSQNLDLLKSEFLLPDIVCDLVSDGEVSVEILPTRSIWQGITYKEDKVKIVNGINELVKEGIYPDKLFDNKK